jgi:hypothetical protein
MLFPRWHSDLMVFTGAVDDLAIRTDHTAADHGHSAADLEDGAVDVDFRP